MIPGLKPYPRMKDSGIPWLGEVPEHWGLQRGKWLFRKMDRAVRESDEVVTCFRDGVVTLRKNRRIRGFTESIKEIGYQGIRRGDLVIHAMDAFAGAIGVSESEGKGTPVYSVCEPLSIANSHYFAHMLREMARSQWVQALSKGIRERSTDFRFETFGAQFLPLPPLLEQATIVRFIDHYDRKIRRYISAKQKMIRLLQEQKQEIINRAVTGQVDVRTGKPYPAYKSSGVEWLGDVPEHWEVRRVRNVVEMRVSNVDKHEKEAERPVRLCNYVDVYKNDRINESIPFMNVTATEEEIDNFCLAPGDVLITKDSEMWNDIGIPAYVEHSAPDIICGYHLAILRPCHEQLCGAFLFWVIQSSNVASQFHIAANGVTRFGLSHGAIASICLPLPSLIEQVIVVEHLDKATKDTELAIKNARREIELLREYRTRLIADVVTGKLDVREAAARLSIETEEPEPLEAAYELVDADDPTGNEELAEALPEEVEA